MHCRLPIANCRLNARRAVAQAFLPVSLECRARVDDRAPFELAAHFKKHRQECLCHRHSLLQSTIDNRQSATGFTLVELIISIGLVLVIMLGVNFVFKMTSDTINAGQSLNENMRNTRASQAVLFEDFSKYAPDGASLLLKSKAQLAFRNQADQDSDGDYNEGAGQGARENAITTISDLNNDGDFLDLGEAARAARPSDRSHRVDVVSFFARGNFTRQTGGDVGGGGVGDDEDPLAPLVSDMSSNEAWIWYGHLALPNNNGEFYVDPPTNSIKTNPGFGTATSNPNNFFASKWALGRFAALLVEPYDDDNDPNTPDVILDKTGSAAGNPQVFIGRDPSLPGTSNSRQPLTRQSTAYYRRQNGATVSNSSGPIELLDARFDLIGTSITGYRGTLTNAIGNLAVNGNWWDEMMLATRFETTPFLVKPIKAPSFAAQAPFFMNSCTQFIVEYAGDFVTQNNNPNDVNYGQVLNGYFDPATPSVLRQTDGEIDYVVVPAAANGTIPLGSRPNARKQIRWYGLPRDTNGDGRVLGGQAHNNQMPDVVPLRDILRTATIGGYGAGGLGAPFERDIDTELPIRADYLGSTPLSFDHSYTCAWGPSDTVRPRMIRITMVVDDPSGRTVEPQTHEYVFNLPAGE